MPTLTMTTTTPVLSTTLTTPKTKEDPPQLQTPINLNPITSKSTIMMTSTRPLELNTPNLHIQDQHPARSSSFLSDLIDEDFAPQVQGPNIDQLSPAPALTDHTTTTTCIQTDSHLNHFLQKNHKDIVNKINKNTRAIRCIDKAVNSQNQIMKDLNESLVTIKN